MSPVTSGRAGPRIKTKVFRRRCPSAEQDSTYLMKNSLICALAIALAVSAACGDRNVLAPTSGGTQAGIPPTTGSGSAARAQSITGAWTSAAQAEPDHDPEPRPEPELEPEPAPTPTPDPEPEPTPAPPQSVFHVGPGPLSVDRAKEVVSGTSNEFPHLTSVMGSERAAAAAADELLGRTIWHLQLAGFQAARQRNPSGAISSDKVSIIIDGRWRVYDIFSLGTAGRATRVQWLEVPLPDPVGNDGIPD